MPRRPSKKEHLSFEESACDSWARDLDVAEVPIGNRPIYIAAAMVVLLVGAVLFRIFYLNIWQGSVYQARAARNLTAEERYPGPRGTITDRAGNPLADNRPVFSLLLKPGDFFKYRDYQDQILELLQKEGGLAREEVLRVLEGAVERESIDAITMISELSQEQLVRFKAESMPALVVAQRFERTYPGGAAWGTILGYTGLASSEDLTRTPGLTPQTLVGKAGVEAFYDSELRGEPGVRAILRDARGAVLEEKKISEPKIGAALQLSVDRDFQEYFYNRLKSALSALGRTTGVGIALDPRNGEVLALISLPSYDPNIFSIASARSERKQLLEDKNQPLFNRTTSGRYNPGSTIKPLVGFAALAENIISPERAIFSPGYLDIPNPYDPSRPARFLDWRYQGSVNLADALAQSSNVYFYTVGGGANGIKGLGISGLNSWWQKFGLGSATGIDLPQEAKGFLPTPEWKEEATDRPWRLGDTYNVSIGQGDLLLTPIQLATYVAGIANGGIAYRPHLKKDLAPVAFTDLSEYSRELTEVQKGMRRTVVSPMGTAHKLNDLPFPVYGKTGSAQIQNNTKENAFFVAYASRKTGTPAEIAILVLVENAREGSLNAVPVGRDVLEWYYENRMK